MFRFWKPDDAAVLAFLTEQASLDLTYAKVGATRSTAVSPPAGYAFDHARVVLGSGRETFDAAVAALRRWRQFDVGWAEALPIDTPLAPDEAVAVRVRTAGLWSLHACRIVYVIDEHGPVTRFGFGYGTLPGHAESGEERFLIEWDQMTEVVSYEVSAFFRPRHLLVQIGWPIGKRLVNRFRRDSAEAMQRAAARESHMSSHS